MARYAAFELAQDRCAAHAARARRLFLRVHLGGFSASNPAVAAEQNGGVRSGRTSRYASGGRSKQVGDSTRYGIRSTHAAQ